MRHLIIDKKEYSYTIGHTGVKIKNSNGKGLFVPFNTLLDRDWDSIQKDQHKKAFEISPHHIADYIKKQTRLF